tara:strand:+ start:536 stop:673 length:138 start_codon:yes stop_codon:yes gene_type:complete
MFQREERKGRGRRKRRKEEIEIENGNKQFRKTANLRAERWKRRGE